MTDDGDFERRLAGWLQSTAPLPAADLADRLLRTTAATPQRRRWLARSGPLRLLGAAAVVAVAVVVGLQFASFLPGPMPPVGGEPSATEATPSEATPSETTSTPASSAPATESASATPSPSPEVFPGGNRCQNDTDGYAVDYPADWYANEEIPASDGFDSVPACRYFAPNEFEVQPNAGLPPTVAISVQRAPEETPVDGSLLSSEQTTVGGRQATRRESETGEGGFGMPPGTLIYEYLIALAGGDVLIFSTDSSGDGDYAEHRQVLDLMMNSLEIQP